MLFHSTDFLLFLTLSTLGYWGMVRLGGGRLLWLFSVSCLFYMAWHPAYIALIFASTLLDFGVGLQLGRLQRHPHRPLQQPRSPFAWLTQGWRCLDRPRLWLLLSLSGNLGLLFTFKYYNFVISTLGQGAGLVGFTVELPVLRALLPVGISFYTFQTLSYTIDVYRGRLQPCRNLLQFASFVIFFPQLVAGPIVRAAELLPQLKRKPHLVKGHTAQALFMIATGLVKKIAIADFLSVNLVDRVFDHPEGYTAVEVVLALYAFTMQIYCDFSGYTDVARGSAMLMGLSLPDNFQRPYQARNPADFWRRWHMTLSSWLRDYLYFPLGGSRVGPWRAYGNLWLTMFLIGLWHGAAWTFVLYGALQATAMVLHRLFRRTFGQKPRPQALWREAIKVILCLQFVVFSRLLFRATSLDNAGAVFARLCSGSTSVAQLSGGVWLVLGLSFAAHYSPARWFAWLQQRFVRLPPILQGMALGALGLALATVATAAVVPYIYFQF